MKRACSGGPFPLLPLLLALSLLAPAQTLSTRPAPAPAPAAVAANSDPTYQQLRNVGLSGEVSTASNLVLKRDAGTFTFRSGSFYFLAPVNGKVTGAVFLGEGSFNLTPPLDVEKKSLSLLTKEPGITEEFNELVLLFTDGTYEEIKKAAGAGQAAVSGEAADALAHIQKALRKELHYNLSARILQDVLSAGPGGLFAAFIKGKKYSGKMLYVVDPRGDPAVAPQEVFLSTYDDNKSGFWCAFHLSGEYGPGNREPTHKTGLIDIERQQLDTTVEKNGKLSGDATTTFVAKVPGVRVVPFELYGRLRVQTVTGADGQALEFIQEDKDEDPDFAVILPEPLSAGERFVVRTVYSGTEAVTVEGVGNYYPVARANWYPATRFDDYAAYEMRFAIPKGMKMAATGIRVDEVNEGDQVVSRWRSEVPQTVAGFNFGKFKEIEKKLTGINFTVEAYANEEPPEWVKGIQTDIELNELAEGETNPLATVVEATLGNVTTVGLLQKALAEGELSVRLFTDYFGPLPYTRIAMTQQAAPNFGQAWPSLVWLPISAFFDTTIRHQLHMDDPKGYFKIVAPHEVAHQWWGHTVTWASYRDQWMSEGFSDFSASLFLQVVRKNQGEFVKFWGDEKDLLTERNAEGKRPIDVGPVTLGYRLSNSKAGFDIVRRLIYPKGAYILHMLRMLMWHPQSGDERFKAMMKDFVKTYTNQPASTEDFKAVVERHMIPEMNLAGNGKMDWFFNQFVYGTALPDYKFESSFVTGPNDDQVLVMKLTQSNVDPQFRMRVPVYVELAKGNVVRLGSVHMIGNSTIEEQVPLTGVKDRPKRAMVNYLGDVLCTQNGK